MRWHLEVMVYADARNFMDLTDDKWRKKVRFLMECECCFWVDYDFHSDDAMCIKA